MIVLDITSEHDIHTCPATVCVERIRKHSDMKKKQSCKSSDGNGFRGFKPGSVVNIRAKPLLQQLASMSPVIHKTSGNRHCACSENPPPWFFVYMNKVIHGDMNKIVCVCVRIIV